MNPITKLRKKHNYSQTQLAELLGVHQTAVSQWELGKTLPDILTAKKLSLIFGVTIEDLLNDTDIPSVNTISKIRNNCGKLNEIALQKVLEYTNDLIATEKYEKESVLPNSEDTRNGNH